jgi:hypothetical protein
MSWLDDPDNPYSTHTVMGWIRSWSLGKELEAGYNDQATIDREFAQLAAASAASDAQFWAAMRADGVPVADPQPDPEPGSFAERYAAAAAATEADQWVADHAPAAEVSTGEPDAHADAADLEPEAEPELEAEL